MSNFHFLIKKSVINVDESLLLHLLMQPLSMNKSF